jgi:sterol desaturase/sphingolipid hydroxylase (fatty acid hydroxylase superfamily)
MWPAASCSHCCRFRSRAPIFALAWDHRIFTVTLNSALMVFLLFIGQEFCYYWYHRASHRIRFFWATHAVHHSPNQLTLSSAYRLGLTGKLTGSAIFSRRSCGLACVRKSCWRR